MIKPRTFLWMVASAIYTSAWWAWAVYTTMPEDYAKDGGPCVPLLVVLCIVSVVLALIVVFSSEYWEG